MCEKAWVFRVIWTSCCGSLVIIYREKVVSLIFMLLVCHTMFLQMHLLCCDMFSPTMLVEVFKILLQSKKP